VAARDQFRYSLQESGSPRCGGFARWPAPGSRDRKKMFGVNRSRKQNGGSLSGASWRPARFMLEQLLFARAGISSQHKQVMQAVSNQGCRDRPEVAAVKAAWMVIGYDPNRARLNGVSAERPRLEQAASGVP